MDLVVDFVMEPPCPAGHRARRTDMLHQVLHEGCFPWEVPPPPRSQCSMDPKKKRKIEDYREQRKHMETRIVASREAHKAVACLPTDIAEIILDRAGVLRPKVLFRARHE